MEYAPLFHPTKERRTTESAQRILHPASQICADRAFRWRFAEISPAKTGGNQPFPECMNAMHCGSLH
jgi:hypothetical protein